MCVFMHLGIFTMSKIAGQISMKLPRYVLGSTGMCLTQNETTGLHHHSCDHLPVSYCKFFLHEVGGIFLILLWSYHHESLFRFFYRNKHGYNFKKIKCYDTHF